MRQEVLGPFACEAGAGKTFLVTAAVDCATAVQYVGLLRDFQDFCQEQSFALQSVPEIAVALTDYVNFLFSIGEDMAIAIGSLAAWADSYPDFLRLGCANLPRVDRARQGVRMLAPGFVRVPIPWSVTPLVLCDMFVTGACQAAWRWSLPSQPACGLV